MARDPARFDGVPERIGSTFPELPRPTPQGGAPARATLALSSTAKAKHLLYSLVRLTPEQIAEALKDPVTFGIIMSLPPEVVTGPDGPYQNALKMDANDARRDDALKAAKILEIAYCKELAETNPVLLAAYLERENSGKTMSAALALARASPELAYAAIARQESAREFKQGSWMGLQVVTEAIAGNDPELAVQFINSNIHLLHSNRMQDKWLIEQTVIGFASGVNMEHCPPWRFATLLSSISDEVHARYPQLSAPVNNYHYLPPTEVLAAFPLDGTPWQRAGAIAYLEAAAFKGMNGDVYVSEFLESPQVALLTEEERGRLRHILRKE